MGAALPSPLVTAGTTAGLVLASTPGSLPQTFLAHVIVVTVVTLLWATATAVIGVITRIWWEPPGPRQRLVSACVALPIICGSSAWNALWQDRLHSNLAQPAVPWTWWATPAVPVAVILMVTLVYTTGARRRRRFALVSLAAAGLTAAAVVALPAPAHGRQSTPVASVSDRFVQTGAGPGALRLYESLDDRSRSSAAFSVTPEWDARARDLTRRWVAAGGLSRAAVVIAVPTGSGWVDPDAVTGFEHRFAGDVGVLAGQYDAIPSWRAFVSDRDRPGAATVAILRAVLDAIGSRAGGHRPQVYLYGQSLGAIGADAARGWAVTHRPGQVCATVVAGAPADTVAARAADRVVIANRSDPVTRWSPRLLWSAPRTASTEADLPAPQWIPIGSFLATSADLVSALTQPTGHGHRYGAEQGLRAPDCRAGQTIGPRALS
ncbi:alpha/beta-hydrolase family protein [Williamsia sterculiae]|uniref:alpha/beta-hydrolase family protein n=1 Tax=Williamsia sterculiae TaxID=1344003 RepID=UPI0009712BFF|nr:alpha/beta-hydrolase family protein [Williamsia sterculiae]